MKSKRRGADPIQVDTPEGASPVPQKVRKLPHCSKCDRAKAGHPRTGCPFVNDEEQYGHPSPVIYTTHTEEPHLPDIGPETVVNALNALSIGGARIQEEGIARDKPVSSLELRALTLRLARSSKATVYHISKELCEEIAQEIMASGLCAEAIIEEDGAFLIVGKDRTEVGVLKERLSTTAPEGCTATVASATSSGGSAKAVAGGMMAGAVGVWAGLAFS